MPTLKQLVDERLTVRVLRNDAALPYEKRDEWQRRSNSYRVQLKSNRGNKAFTFDFWHGSGIRETPDERPAEVVESLLSDADAGQMSFEDFCSNLGYDTDSRKAEQTWKECKKIHAQMKRVLGSEFNKFMQAER